MSITVESYPWLKNYPKGVPYEINPQAYNSLLDLLDESFGKFAEKPAYSFMDKKLSFAEIDRLSAQFAAYLQSLGLHKGDRIAIQMPNVLQYPVALFGAIRAGLIVVNTNPLYTPREMEFQFKDSGVKAIVILANFAEKLEKVLSRTDIQHVIVTQVGDLLGFPKKQIVNAVVKYVKKMVPAYRLPNAVSFGETLTRGAQTEYKRPEVANSDVVFIQYTGGTTGVSKGAMLTHANLIANCEGAYEWMMPALRELSLKKQPVFLAALPLYHVFALTVNGFIPLKIGGMNLLISNPRDLPALFKELQKTPVHAFPGLNTLFNGMLNHPDFKKADFSELQLTLAGGMALQSTVAERWKKETGCWLAEGYGLSETSPVLSANPLVGPPKIGTIGLPWPSTELRIRKDDESWAAPGERGEICAKGPQIMLGYYNRPDETEKVIFNEADDRWFRTGDIGIEDADGYFRIVDRKKDMILVSGFNVFPNEVEEVAAQCPGVLEVACIGVPDAKSNEVVKLYIVKKDPDLTEETVKSFCKQNLTAYKCPKYVEFRTELPKTNVGKILRRTLKEEYMAKLTS